MQDTTKIDLKINEVDSLINEKISQLVVELIDKPILFEQVNEQSQFDVIVLWVSLIGSIAAFLGAIFAFWELFRKDAQKQFQINQLKEQTDQLIKQNSLFEKRIRMQVKPLIWSNGNSLRISGNRFTIDINNRGKIAFLTKVELIKGEGITFNAWNGKKIQIESGIENGIILTGNYDESIDPKNLNFQFKIEYIDTENYRYETYFHWRNGVAEITETIEL